MIDDFDKLSVTELRQRGMIFALLVLVAWPLSIGVLAVEPGKLGHNVALVIYFAVTPLATTLPTAIWAWREPDPVEPKRSSS